MPLHIERPENGSLKIQIDAGEIATVITQSELTRIVNRSPDFVRARIEDGSVRPFAKTESGMKLFLPDAIFKLIRGNYPPDGMQVKEPWSMQDVKEAAG